ncbi:SDR family oxidoreductase [Nisaea acidiphila]|uniref:SDR family oxidoreductase n=1 Tax=Nisaea acidiphila TaxID=1862145 RepID=A0A9J7AS20_9PROT|nr:SDR family NAD(P)-dependent oxidoreductase [Nisaea acidiphila]UUX49124.1 SDR family oxidoreductase [Nisaea acidiphila]
MRLKDKVAIVVGAGQQPGETIGNGRAVALRFAEEGAKLLLVDANEDWARETEALCRESGAETEVLKADITNEEDCRRIAETCKARFGRIDILHNNVGRSRGDRPTPEMDAAMWDELMAMNLKGMFLTAKHVLPVMREQRSGVILNISSTSSLAARGTVTYKTSKGAVNTLTQHLAMENAPYGIRANVILPGLVDTPMAIERRAKETGKDREAIRAERKADVPLAGRAGTAWDVANAALYLASNEAGYVTGVCLPVDGGLTANVG